MAELAGPLRVMKIALHAALRHGALLGRPNRLAGVAIEHKHRALLGRLNHNVPQTVPGIDARFPAAAEAYRTVACLISHTVCAGHVSRRDVTKRDCGA